MASQIPAIATLVWVNKRGPSCGVFFVHASERPHSSTSTSFGGCCLHAGPLAREATQLLENDRATGCDPGTLDVWMDGLRIARIAAITTV